MARKRRAVSIALVRSARIDRQIYLVRGLKVMVDRDLAELYGVSTKALNQAVRRNRNRFPGDFMFQLTSAELKNWRSQSVTSNSAAKMGLRYRPFVFTEHGVAMLSSVLRSERAALVSIEMMRTFVRLRELLSAHADLVRRLDELEKKYDKRFVAVFDAIRQLMIPMERTRRRRIGFQAS